MECQSGEGARYGNNAMPLIPHDSLLPHCMLQALLPDGGTSFDAGPHCSI